MNELKYEVILYWDNNDSIFIAEIPELAGCMAQGLSKKEALKNAEKAAQFWLQTAKEDNQEIPVPKGIAILK
jgi:predicted RNase H-like HicB family nuclease